MESQRNVVRTPGARTQNARTPSAMKQTGEIMNKYLAKLNEGMPTGAPSRRLDFRTPRPAQSAMEARKAKAVRDAEEQFREKLQRARTLAASANRERLTAEAKLAAVLEDNDLLRDEVKEVKEVNALLESSNAELRDEVKDLKKQARGNRSREASPRRGRRAHGAASGARDDAGLPPPPQGATAEQMDWYDDVKEQYLVAVARLERAELKNLNSAREYSSKVTELRRIADGAQRDIGDTAQANYNTPVTRPVTLSPMSDVSTPPASSGPRPPMADPSPTEHHSHPFGLTGSPARRDDVAYRLAAHEPPPVCCTVQ